MGKYPEYVAISDTWAGGGCQRKDLSPWGTLDDARFKLKDLPTSLDKLEYDFVWMDLLTKPQEELSEAMIERKKRQILVARQVGIFRLAGTAIAW